jgi:hypothetical protein
VICVAENGNLQMANKNFLLKNNCEKYLEDNNPWV